MGILDQMRGWLATGSEAGRDWNGWCQALVWWACEMYGTRTVTYPNATSAREASEIVSTDPYAAPEGAIHYWNPEGEPNGHVAIALGGGLSLMASPYVDEYLGVNVGVVDVPTYSRRTASAYVGWAYTNGANHLPIHTPDQEDDDMTPDQDERLRDIRAVQERHSEAIHEIRGLVQNIAAALPGVAVDAHGAHESADISAYLGHQLRDMSREQMTALRAQIDQHLSA